jgi:hypothetical protein
MKNIIRKFALMAGIAIIGTSSLFAQKSGVFKSFADYKTGKMEYGINCATEMHKIKLNDFLGKDYITVIHEGKSNDIKKAETWGFQLCDEKIVRFQGKEDFQVSEKDLLWIYAKQTLQSGNNKNTASKYVTSFYFSKDGDGKILELTPNNVKAAFPDNHKLHDAIEMQFPTSASISEFDEFHKKFKINHFLEAQGIK